MAARVPLKVAQLATLPALLVALALGKGPRHPQVTTPGAEPEPNAVLPVERFFAAGAPPALAVDLDRVAAVVTSQTAGNWFQVTVVAELPDEAAASRLAGELVELLAASARHYEESASEEVRARLLDGRNAAPLTPPEAAAFARRGVRSEIGIGWPGAGKDAGSAVVVLGRVLAVAGLKGDFAGLRPNPLAAFLEGAGAKVLVEGEPSGGAAPVLDVLCDAPDEPAAARLGRTLEHYLRAPTTLFLRPPWHPARVSPEEDRARATFVALDRAVRRALTDPRLFEDLRDRMRWGSNDPASITRAFEQVRKEHALAAIDEAARRVADPDPAVVEELRRAQTGALGGGLDPAARARLGERLGSLAVEVVAPRAPGAAASVEPTADERAYGASGHVQVQGRRVSLGRVVFHRFARGLPALLLELKASGCSGVKLGLTRELPARFAPPADLYDPEDD